MYYNTTVKIPSVKGKIITKKKGTASYVLYQYGQDYKPEKKYVVPLRTIIGKINPDDPAYRFPNERFQEYFSDAVMPEELPEAYRSCALRIGSYAVIRKVLNVLIVFTERSHWLLLPKDYRLSIEKCDMVYKGNDGKIEREVNERLSENY